MQGAVPPRRVKEPRRPRHRPPLLRPERLDITPERLVLPEEGRAIRGGRPRDRLGGPEEALERGLRQALTEIVHPARGQGEALRREGGERRRERKAPGERRRALLRRGLAGPEEQRELHPERLQADRRAPIEEAD